MADYQDEDGSYYHYSNNYNTEQDDDGPRYNYYQPPLSQHHHAAHDSSSFDAFYQPTAEENLVTRVLMLFNTRGALVAVAVSIGVILFTQHNGTLCCHAISERHDASAEGLYMHCTNNLVLFLTNGPSIFVCWTLLLGFCWCCNSFFLFLAHHTSNTDDIRAWFAYYFPRDVAVTDSLRVLALQGIQLIYGWLQYFFSGALWERWLEWTRASCTRTGRADGRVNTIRRNAAEPLPALEWAPQLSGAVVVADLQPQKRRARFVHAQMNTLPLEPTFLHAEDYPAAWMVYHRILGVVKKTEAEEFDKQMAEQNQQQLAKNNDEDKEPINEEEEEEKKDEVQSSTEIDDEKTVHHSNVSSIRREKAASQDDSSSSSDNNPSAASFPVLHSIAATG